MQISLHPIHVPSCTLWVPIFTTTIDKSLFSFRCAKKNSFTYYLTIEATKFSQGRLNIYHQQHQWIVLYIVKYPTPKEHTDFLLYCFPFGPLNLPSRKNRVNPDLDRNSKMVEFVTLELSNDFTQRGQVNNPMDVILHFRKCHRYHMHNTLTQVN